MLSPFIAKNDEERAVLRRAIGPVKWDPGNEVWLLTAGGALFAAFPDAYATTFSGFYLAVMLVLFGLIVRAPCPSGSVLAIRPGESSGTRYLLLCGLADYRRCCSAWRWATSSPASPWTAGDTPACLGQPHHAFHAADGAFGLGLMFLAAGAAGPR
ncbi:MAG: cytochrome d ubiquinol oxidase subunit II [Adlercreutzia equolifaciens]